MIHEMMEDARPGGGHLRVARRWCCSLRSFSRCSWAPIAVGAVLGGVPPWPFGSAEPIYHYFASQHVAVRASAVGIFASSVPLAIYAATASARLRQLGVTAPGTTIALVGGVLAAGSLSAAGMLLWTLSQPSVTAAMPLTRALYFLTFLMGGTAHVVGLGLLVAGMAVPGLIIGLLPKPLAWAGLGIAVVAELTTLVLIWPALSILIPIARFGGLVWLVAAGLLLPKNRREVRT